MDRVDLLSERYWELRRELKDELHALRMERLRDQRNAVEERLNASWRATDDAMWLVWLALATLGPLALGLALAVRASGG